MFLTPQVEKPRPKAKLLTHMHHATCVSQVLCPLGGPRPQALLPELDAQLPPFLPHLTHSRDQGPVPWRPPHACSCPQLLLGTARPGVLCEGLHSGARSRSGHLIPEAIWTQTRTSNASVTPEAGETPGIEPPSRPQWNQPCPHPGLGLPASRPRQYMSVGSAARLGCSVRQPG